MLFEPCGRSEPVKASRKATRSAVSWTLASAKAGSSTKRAALSTLPSCSTPKPARLSVLVRSQPDLS